MTEGKVFRQSLADGDTLAIIGGGPAGAFSAMHVLRLAREHRRQIRVLLFEESCQPGKENHSGLSGPYAGCPQCAGGISPRLYDALESLDIDLPPEVIQARIASVTVQGNWKSITLPVPKDRHLLSVYRGTLPFGQHHTDCFDARLLKFAERAGAELIGSRVLNVNYDAAGRLHLAYLARGLEAQLTADFVIFAGGVNPKSNKAGAGISLVSMFQQLQPAYTPPRLRKALIFELEALAGSDMTFKGELHYIESSAQHLQLEMCSVLSKRGYITVTLVGKSVDEANNHKQNMQVIKDFMALPQTHRTLPPGIQPTIRCICNPNLVVGSATTPYGQRIAAVGDMATSRQYKDGILSAHNMAQALALALFEEGTDERSLELGYGPTIANIRRDNLYAKLIFFFYRRFFTSPFLSRIIYQAFASEKKAKPENRRTFKKVFWSISSGDAAYKDIAWSILQPSTLWLLLWGGLLTTLRNGLFEWFFGLDWRGIGRVPTAVSRRELKAKRVALLGDDTRSRLRGRLPEFEGMYTIHVRSSVDVVRRLLGQLGDDQRPYLKPRWVNIRLLGGEPLQPGSVIGYEIFYGFINFSIELQADTAEDLIVYKIQDGFAHGGAFVFELENLPDGTCNLTIYLAFDYARGESLSGRIYRRMFKLLFPEFIHDVVWNHALCELKQSAELSDHFPPQVQLV